MDFIFKKLLLTVTYNGLIFHFKHIMTEWCNVKQQLELFERL